MPIADRFTAPPINCERADPEELQWQIDCFTGGSLNRQLIDTIPTPLMILNGHHQIVYANQSLLDMVSSFEGRQVYGLRPGEALACAVAHHATDGCGTTEACQTCGAVLATISSMAGRNAEQVCSINSIRGGQLEAHDLRVKTTPLRCAEDRFTIFSFTDISHEKRRRALERIFFHDLLNIAGSIRGFAEILQSPSQNNQRECYDLIHAAAERAIEEIEAQRILTAAETQELQVRPAPLHLGEFLQATTDIYRRHEAAADRELKLDLRVPDMLLVSDRALLGRVLGNLIKNALEACRPGETVTVGCNIEEQGVRFSVHNPGTMPEEVRRQLFKRSFSTKGSGRGLGTYSLQLLCGYLQSEVSFTSSEEEGTIFRVIHPLTLPSKHL